MASGQYTFKVSRDSKLESALDTALEGGTFTKSSLVDGGENLSAVKAMYYLSRWTDNFLIERDGATYIDAAPDTIIHQADNVEVAAALTPETPGRDDSDADADAEQLAYPQTPSIPEPASFFIKPSWYGRMKAMVKLGKHVALAGPPGVGKSLAIEQLAIDEGKPLVNISSDAGLRRRDLTGNVQLVNGHTRFMVAEYAMAAMMGWWVKIDEINSAEPDALMYLNGQIASPYTVNFYGKSFPVHPDFRLFATYNPGLVGTKPLPDSLKDRFFPIKLAFPSDTQLRLILEANGMPGVDVTWTQAIVAYGHQAWEQHLAGRLRYQITPRRLMDAVSLVEHCDLNVFTALDAAVIGAVDKVSEVNVLKSVLSTVKKEYNFSRLV